MDVSERKTTGESECAEPCEAEANDEYRSSEYEVDVALDGRVEVVGRHELKAYKPSTDAARIDRMLVEAFLGPPAEPPKGARMLFTVLFYQGGDRKPLTLPVYLLSGDAGVWVPPPFLLTERAARVAAAHLRGYEEGRESLPLELIDINVARNFLNSERAARRSKW